MSDGASFDRSIRRFYPNSGGAVAGGAASLVRRAPALRRRPPDHRRRGSTGPASASPRSPRRPCCSAPTPASPDAGPASATSWRAALHRRGRRARGVAGPSRSACACRAARATGRRPRRRGAAMIQWLYFVAIDRVPVGSPSRRVHRAVLVALCAASCSEQVRAVMGLAGPVARRAGARRRVWRACLDPVASSDLGGRLPPPSSSSDGAPAAPLDPLAVNVWMFAFAAAFWSSSSRCSIDREGLGRSTSLLGALDGVRRRCGRWSSRSSSSAPWRPAR